MVGITLDPRVPQPAPPAPMLDENAISEELDRKHRDMRLFRRDSVIVVINVPKIGADMYQRLVKKFTPLFEKAAVIRRDANDKPCLKFPQGEDQGSLGFAFAEYADPDQARRAAHALDGKKIDRNHTFRARCAPDFDRLQDCPEKFVPPQPLPVASPDQPNYRSWLLDNRGRDMFLLRSADTVSVMWNDHIVKPSLVSSFISYS